MDEAERRAAERRARYTGGIARSFAEMADVDVAFWLRTTAVERLRAMWPLVEDALALEGQRGPAPRLQRSVGGVRPRRG